MFHNFVIRVINLAESRGGVEAWVSALLGVSVVSLVSLVGAAALMVPLLRMHRLLLVLVAAAAGTLMGDAFIHLLPEAVEVWDGKPMTSMTSWVLGGFVAFFLLEIVLRARHAHVEVADVEHHAHGHGVVAHFAWTNLVGDAIHNFLDGAVIATAFLVDTGVGVATTLAVVVHEVPQELGDFAVLLRAGLRPSRALLLNFGSAVLAVLGAVVVLVLPVGTEVLEAYGLPLIAGAFVYIAAADLIPELHHHSKGRDAVLLLTAFLGGIGLMGGLLALEEAGVLAGA